MMDEPVIEGKRTPRTINESALVCRSKLSQGDDTGDVAEGGFLCQSHYFLVSAPLNLSYSFEVS